MYLDLVWIRRHLEHLGHGWAEKHDVRVFVVGQIFAFQVPVGKPSSDLVSSPLLSIKGNILLPERNDLSRRQTKSASILHLRALSHIIRQPVILQY